MPTINDYKKKALNDAGYSGDISTAEWKWLKAVCSPYVGAIPDMWRYALRQVGFTGNDLPDMQNKMFASLGLTGAFPNKWYKYWRDTPLDGVSWWGLGSALDLDFANSRGFNSIDRTKTTPDSILTYTSPSPKLVYGSDGVLRYAPHNLLLQSQTFETASWSKGNCTVTANAAVAPDGTMTADLVTNAAASAALKGVSQSLTPGVALTRVFIYAKANGYNFLSGTVTSSIGRFTINLATGAYTNYGGTQVVTSTAVGNDWYLVTAYFLNWTVLSAVIWGANDTQRDPITAWTSDGVSGVYLWGAQVEAATTSTPSTYIPTTTAAVYSLPIDHNPTTFEPLGVLIEEARTNLLTYSEQFDDAAWSKSDATVTANAAVAPNGTTTADKLIPNAAATNGRAIQVVAGTIGATYTLTVFGKQGEFTNCRLYADDGGSNVASVSYNLSTGVVSTAAAVSGGNWTAVSTTITPSYDGYYRMSLTWTATTVAPSRYGVWCRDTGDGTSGLYIWGAQLEAGAFPTSYIPTVASQVTRAADQVSILTSAFAYNAAAGTFAVAANPAQVSTSAYPASLDDGASNELIGIRIVSSRWRLYVRDNSVDQSNIDAGSAQASVMVAAAAAWAADDFAISRNGASALTDGTGTLPTVTKLNVGRVSAGDVLNGHIKRLTYFPTRRSNADLVVLST